MSFKFVPRIMGDLENFTKIYPEAIIAGMLKEIEYSLQNHVLTGDPYTSGFTKYVGHSFHILRRPQWSGDSNIRMKFMSIFDS